MVDVDLAYAFPAHSVNKLGFDVVKEVLLGTAEEFSSWDPNNFIPSQCLTRPTPSTVPKRALRVAGPAFSSINIMNANLCTTTFSAVATKLVMNADLRPFTLLTLSCLLTMLAYVFPTTFFAVVFLSVMGAVVLGRANPAFIFLLVVGAKVPAVLTAIFVLSMGAPCCLRAFFFAMNATFTSTAVSVDLKVFSIQFHLTSGTLKEHLYVVVFSHFQIKSDSSMLLFRRL